MKYAKTTLQKIETAITNGGTIIENKNWKYKGVNHGFRRVEMLARTNSRIHGYPKRIVWACYK